MYTPDLSIYQGIHPDRLPKEWFPFYVVYQFGWLLDRTYIIGFTSDVEAAKMQEEFLKKKDIVRCEIFGHFPVELLKNGKV